jgi:hypothetical protein
MVFLSIIALVAILAIGYGIYSMLNRKESTDTADSATGNIKINEMINTVTAAAVEATAPKMAAPKVAKPKAANPAAKPAAKAPAKPKAAAPAKEKKPTKAKTAAKS